MRRHHQMALASLYGSRNDGTGWTEDYAAVTMPPGLEGSSLIDRCYDSQPFFLSPKWLRTHYCAT